MTWKLVLVATSLVIGLVLAPGISGAVADETDPVEALAGRCAYCHGTDGISPMPIWPSLAGLERDYLEGQLDIFARGPAGGRNTVSSHQMHALSAWLDDEQRGRLASYFSGMAPPQWESRPDAPGGDLYQNGASGIPGCATCHGDDAAGNSSLNAPRLAGQPARYIGSQLRAYADGRRNDQNSGMAAVAGALNDNQIDELAEYLAQRRPSRP